MFAVATNQDNVDTTHDGIAYHVGVQVSIQEFASFMNSCQGGLVVIKQGQVVFYLPIKKGVKMKISLLSTTTQSLLISNINANGGVIWP